MALKRKQIMNKVLTYFNSYYVFFIRYIRQILSGGVK